MLYAGQRASQLAGEEVSNSEALEEISDAQETGFALATLERDSAMTTPRPVFKCQSM